jgi:hypothetical protein
MEHSYTTGLTFVYTLPQEFASRVVPSVITNTLAQIPPAHRLTMPIFREEKHSTSHFH